ncbi:MAG: 4-carboxymuconolactone decarboxylase [Pseudomonadota bacterium]
MSDEEDRIARGMKTRRGVLGDAWVDAANAKRTDFDRDFQDYITGMAWNDVWSRPGLTRRERSMITIALLAGLGQWDEVAMHTRATLNTGASRDDLREVMFHVAVYAGVPAANHAIKVMKQVFAEIDAKT